MLNKTKVAVLVSGGGTNLQAIIDAGKNGIIKSGEIVQVVSNKKNAYALERAKKNNIPAAYARNEKDILKILDDSGAELIVLAGFLSILSKEFIRKYPNRIINIHPALIPSFCGKGAYGLHVHEMALDYGVKVTGATVHFVNEIPDGGKIIAQKAVEVKDGDTPEVLQKRVMEQAEWILLPRAVEKLSKEIQEGKE